MYQSVRSFWLSLGILVLSFFPKFGFTLGLGPIQLHSYLNEPLNANIVLQGAEDMDLSHILVSLGSVEDFKRIELGRPYFLSTLQFEVVRQNQETFVKVTSDAPIKQPYLSFLVSMTFPEGRVVKDYTLLLDPAPLKPLSDASVALREVKTLKILEEKLAEESIVPKGVALAETNTSLGELDQKSPIIRDKKSTHENAQIVSKAPVLIQLKNVWLEKRILLLSGLGLLLVVALSAFLFKRARASMPFLKNTEIPIEEAPIFLNEEIELKFDLANQYLGVQDMENAINILQDIIARGSEQEVKLAEKMLEKIEYAEEK